MPRCGRVPPSAPRPSRGRARAGGRPSGALVAGRVRSGYPREPNNARLPACRADPAVFPGFFHPGVCVRCLQPCAASDESVAPGKAQPCPSHPAAVAVPPTGSLQAGLALQRQDHFVLGFRGGEINIIFVSPHHSRTSG